MIFRSLRASKLAVLLASGMIGVIPTDTIYGISCSALNRLAVERVYTVRGRDRKKPFIILIGSFSDFALFGIRLTRNQADTLKDIWPAPVSIILPCRGKKFSYLHRGTTSLAFRMPNDRLLVSLLQKTGPLITTSVNPAPALWGGVNPKAFSPATTITQAKKYFGAECDFYVDGGRRAGKPSTLLRLEGSRLTLIRAGAYRWSYPAKE